MAWSSEGVNYTAFCTKCKLRKNLRGGSRKNRQFICKSCYDLQQQKKAEMLTTSLQQDALEAAKNIDAGFSPSALLGNK